MKEMREYMLNYGGLQDKTYTYQHKIDGSFFENFPDAPIDDCSIIIDIELTKRPSFLKLVFYIDGFIRTACDRCLEPFNQPIFGDYELFIKFGDSQEAEDLDHDVMYIPRGQMSLELGPLLYDYIVLSKPIQTIHPEDENGESTCNKEMLAKLYPSDTKNDIDPRWQALKNIKTKNEENGTSET